jgi:hypothetical protein
MQWGSAAGRWRAAAGGFPEIRCQSPLVMSPEEALKCRARDPSCNGPDAAHAWTACQRVSADACRTVSHHVVSVAANWLVSPSSPAEDTAVEGMDDSTSWGSPQRRKPISSGDASKPCAADPTSNARSPTISQTLSTVRTPAEHRYAFPGSSLSFGVRGRGLFVRPGGTGGDWLPPGSVTRNEGVLGSNPRVGFFVRGNPCITGFHVVWEGAESTSPAVKGSEGQVRASPCKRAGCCLSDLRQTLPPSAVTDPRAGSERVQPRVFELVRAHDGLVSATCETRWHKRASMPRA